MIVPEGCHDDTETFVPRAADEPRLNAQTGMVLLLSTACMANVNQGSVFRTYLTSEALEVFLLRSMPVPLVVRA